MYNSMLYAVNTITRGRRDFLDSPHLHKVRAESMDVRTGCTLSVFDHHEPRDDEVERFVENVT